MASWLRLAFFLGVYSIHTTPEAFGQNPFIPKDQFNESPSPAWTYLPNIGQVYDIGGSFREDVYFHSVGTYPTLYAMKNNTIAIAVPQPDLPDHLNDSIYRIDLAFTGPGAKSPTPYLWEETPQHYNFYEQYTPQGIVGVTGGKRVIYADIYEDIDFHLTSNKWGPKMYIVVKPGGNPNAIRVSWAGHDSLKLDLNGYLDVWFKTKFIKMTQGMAYQQQGENIIPVPWMAIYNIDNSGTYATFEFGAYDPELPLILMVRPLNPTELPAMGGQPLPPEWCTFVAGAQDDAINDLTHDEDGYVYVTGHSRSAAGLPITFGAFQFYLSGASDAFIGRFNEYYEIEVASTWMTYVGGDDVDWGTSLSYDPLYGRLAVVGCMTYGANTRPNFPLAGNPNCYQRPQFADHSGFVAFANATDGQIQYLTRTPGQVFVHNTIDVDVDAEGNTYVVGMGTILSPDEIYANQPGSYVQWNNPEPTGAGLLSGFVLRLTPNADLDWFTQLGGPGDEFVHACAVDKVRNHLYVVGSTNASAPDVNDQCLPQASASGFPICPFEDGYFQSDLNGAGPDGSFPGILYDGFILRFKLPSLELSWGTYFGGFGDEDITDVAVDSDGQVYVSGYSTTGQYTTGSCGWLPNEDGFPKCDANGFFVNTPTQRYQFIARFEDDTKLTWSTKLGDSTPPPPGSASKNTRLAIDENDNVSLYLNTLVQNVGYQPPVPLALGSNSYFREEHNDLGVNGRWDSFLCQFSPGTTLLYSTYFGGLGNDEGRAVTTFNDRIYLAGRTYSVLNFPTHAPEIADHAPYLNAVPQAVLNNKADGFIAQLKYDFTIGIPEDRVGLLNALFIYPNPATDLLTVCLPKGANNGRIALHDATGRLILTELIGERSTVTISTSDLAPGQYVVRLENGSNGQAVSRLIKL